MATKGWVANRKLTKEKKPPPTSSTNKVALDNQALKTIRLVIGGLLALVLALTLIRQIFGSQESQATLNENLRIHLNSRARLAFLDLNRYHRDGLIFHYLVSDKDQCSQSIDDLRFFNQTDWGNLQTGPVRKLLPGDNGRYLCFEMVGRQNQELWSLHSQAKVIANIDDIQNDQGGSIIDCDQLQTLFKEAGIGAYSIPGLLTQPDPVGFRQQISCRHQDRQIKQVVLASNLDCQSIIDVIGLMPGARLTIYGQIKYSASQPQGRLIVNSEPPAGNQFIDCLTGSDSSTGDVVVYHYHQDNFRLNISAEIDPLSGLALASSNSLMTGPGNGRTIWLNKIVPSLSACNDFSQGNYRSGQVRQLNRSDNGHYICFYAQSGTSSPVWWAQKIYGVDPDQSLPECAPIKSRLVAKSIQFDSSQDYPVLTNPVLRTDDYIFVDCQDSWRNDDKRQVISIGRIFNSCLGVENYFQAMGFDYYDWLISPEPQANYDQSLTCFETVSQQYPRLLPDPPPGQPVVASYNLEPNW